MTDSPQSADKARASGQAKKQVVPEDLLEEAFELNMQLEELRMNQKTGDDDPVLGKELETHKDSLEAKYQALSDQLKTYWNEWDRASDAAAQKAPLNKMADLLNRRSYIRNLVRDVNEALEH